MKNRFNKIFNSKTWLLIVFVTQLIMGYSLLTKPLHVPLGVYKIWGISLIIEALVTIIAFSKPVYKED